MLLYTSDWNIKDYIIDKVQESLIIQCFCKNEQKESVCLNITNFLPVFYIKKPDNFDNISFIHFKKHYSKQIYTEESEIVQRKDIYGFQGEKYTEYIKIVPKNFTHYKKLKYSFKTPIKIKNKKYQFSTYNANIDPLLQFFHFTEINPCGTIKIENYTETKVRYSRCIHEYNVDFKNIVESEQKVSEDSLMHCSFDIETYSVDNSFPQPDIPENVITHIGAVFNKSDKYIFSLFCEPTDQENVKHYTFDSEKELLEKFLEVFIEKDPDILYQYNGDKFDGNYIYTRMKYCLVDLDKMSRLKNTPLTIKTDSFTSSAYGTSFYKKLIIPGVINFDVLTYFQRNFKEDSYKLDDISKKYLNNQKNEMTVKEMFESYRFKDYKLARKVAEYCLKDCILPQMLVEKFNIYTSLQSMANVCIVSIGYLLYRGQQIKAYSQISSYSLKKDYIIPDTVLKEDCGFEGATVLEPQVGVHTDPILVLDFASLYPSIIRGHNLCYSSIVLDNNYLNLEGYKYSTFNGITFVQNNVSILPDLLENMAKSRKYEKKLMGKTSGLQKEIHNMNQNAYKISMNSVYGFLAAQTLQCKKIASTVTYIGRQMILETEKQVHKTPFLEVIYGDTDSVFVKYKKDYKNIQELISFGEELSKEITKVSFHGPILLEFEKIFLPFILFSKKRYTGVQYNIDGSSKRTSKGIVTNRRDNCPLLRNIYSDLIDIILNQEENYKQNFIFYVKDFIKKLKENKFDIKDLTITKTLRSDYKNTNLPHVKVSKKMKKRGKQVQSNDRIPYVFIHSGKKLDPQYKKAEDPEYVIENNIYLDYDYYIEKQFRKPIEVLIILIFNLNPRYTRIKKTEELTEELKIRVQNAEFINKIFT